MKLCKYRDFSDPSDVDFERLTNVLTHQAFWSARPDTLNDPEEFVWSCDYDPTHTTAPLLAQVLTKTRGLSTTEARAIAEHAVANNRVEALTEPVIQRLVSRCRDGIGLICFGSTTDNACLWQRYGGDGAGVCVELDAPSSLLDTQIRPVQYPATKSLHIDCLLEASVLPTSAGPVYSIALLSKPPKWAPECELRFVSKKQNVPVKLNGSRISALVIGSSLPQSTRRRIEEIVSRLPYTLPMRQHET